MGFAVAGNSHHSSIEGTSTLDTSATPLFAPQGSPVFTGTATYVFKDQTGATDTVTLQLTSTLSDGTSFGESYGVTAISGTFDGHAITGEIGSANTYVNGAQLSWDNAFFPSATDGDGGSYEGLDTDGVAFASNGVTYTLYSNGSNTLNLYDSTGTLQQVTQITYTAPCFCAGTMILTPAGEVAVETLNAGDLVTTVTGETRAIRWMGRRSVATRFADPMTSMPVRIAAGALADAVPSRDLLVSPCHAMLVDGVLAQAGALVNGASIARELSMPESFTYYHIELADHDLIVANGAPAETFIDNIDRMAFDNWDEYVAIVGEDSTTVEMDFPRAKSARQVPAAVRARLAARAISAQKIAA
jgi:hypothetical protein